MSGKIVNVLSFEALQEILQEDRPVYEIVDALFRKGTELSGVVSGHDYSDYDDFLKAHASENTQLVELEGASTISSQDIVVLKSCPMADEMKKFKTNGSAPAFHTTIVEEYKDQNSGSNAILHPGCIAHQVGRQLIVKNLNIRGITNINYYQLACRNMATGLVVYDDNGLAAVGMTKEQAYALVDGYACLYAIIRN